MRMNQIDAEIIYNEEDLQDLDIIIYKIKTLIESFYNCCILKKDDKKDISKLFEARSYFESCLTMIKGIIEPSDNDFIKKINENHNSHDAVENYLENLLSILDRDSKEIISKAEMADSKIANRLALRLMIKSFREKIVNQMEDLIIIPLMNSLDIYKRNSKKFSKESSKKEIFEYILFREVFVAAKIKGSTTRQKVSLSGMSGNVSFSETNIAKIPKSKYGVQPTTIIRASTTPPDVEELGDIEGFKDIFTEEDETQIEDGI